MKFVEARDGELLIGPPSTGKSHVAKSIVQLATQRGYKVLHREAHTLVEERNEARELGELKKISCAAQGRGVGDRRSVPA